MHTATQAWTLLLLKTFTKRAKRLLVTRPATLCKFIKCLYSIHRFSKKKAIKRSSLAVANLVDFE